MGWFFLRHVPLGRAMAITSAGTSAGAVIAQLTAGAPVVGGLLGFVLSAAALRFHPGLADLSLLLTKFLR
jgi:hypothetical protein